MNYLDPFRHDERRLRERDKRAERTERRIRILRGVMVALLVAAGLFAAIGVTEARGATPPPDKIVTSYQVAVTARRVTAYLWTGYRPSSIAAYCRRAPGETWHGGHGSCHVAATVHVRIDGRLVALRITAEYVQVRAGIHPCRPAHSDTTGAWRYPLAGHPRACLAGREDDNA